MLAQSAFGHHGPARERRAVIECDPIWRLSDKAQEFTPRNRGHVSFRILRKTKK
jgi:hypothetical protein